MSFLFRTASALNVGAGAAFKSIKCHRPSWNCMHFATSAYGIGKTVNLDGFKARRKNAADKLKSATEEVRLRIIGSLDTKNVINGRDVQELIFTAEETDVELVIAALKQLQLQSERMRFSSFYMDAVAMRMFSYLNLPDKALEAFLDEDLKALFVGYNAVVILLDILYRNQMYQDVVHCIDVLEKRQNLNVWSSRGVGCFYMSSCLKINTPETLTNASLYYEKMFNFREPVPELTLLALVITLRTCPEKVHNIMKHLDNRLRSGHPQTITTYSHIQANVMLQTLIPLKKLADIEMYLNSNKCTIAKDTYDSVVTLAKELGLQKPDKIFKGCKILDVSLEDWVNLENSKVSDETDNIVPRKHGSFKGRQEILQ